MLVLRPDQVRRLRSSLVSTFEAQMVDHLREYFASSTAEADDDELIARIRREMERARGYGFETPRTWCQFINLSMALGEGFDAELPWAREILADRDAEAARRIDALNAACIEHLLALEDEKAHRPPGGG